MAEDRHQKTEQPTHRKQQKARDRGQVVKSPELQGSLLLLTGIGALSVLGPWIHRQLLDRFAFSFHNVAQARVGRDTVPAMVADWTQWSAFVVTPMMVLVALGGIASVLWIQGGFVYSTEALSPKLERLNPIEGFKRMFSGRLLFNFARDILKLAITGLVCYVTLAEAIPTIVERADRTLAETLSWIGSTTVELAMKVGAVFLVVGLMDFAYQRRSHINDLKMSRRELKDEAKESEGDPIVKGRIKSQQKELARRRMMMAVPEADVVLTNPTHLAVALKYDPESMGAPKVVAKGERLIAEKIKSIAREYGVPVVENKPLARSLFKLVPVDAEIPANLYRAVAEVLSYVYRVNKRRRGARAGV